MKFHLGLGNFFCQYDSSHKSVMRQVVEAKMGIHYCLDYPGSGAFYRKVTTIQERANIDTITRVPCFDINVLKREVDLTLKALDVEQIGVLQLWGGDEVFDCYNKTSELYQALISLTKSGKIKRFLPQLYYDQTERLITNVSETKTPFAFYGSPIGLHVNPTLLNANNVSNSVAMSIFGGVDRGALPNLFTDEERDYWEFLNHNYSWIEICLMNLNSFKFVSNAVGTTGNAKRMGEIVRFFEDNNTIEPIDCSLLNKISLQSCTQEHMSVNDAEARWNANYKRLRSNKVYVKSLIYFYLKKNKLLHRLVDITTGRS